MLKDGILSTVMTIMALLTSMLLIMTGFDHAPIIGSITVVFLVMAYIFAPKEETEK